MNKYDDQAKDDYAGEQNTSNSACQADNDQTSSYPVPTDFSRHFWLFLLIALSVCIAAVISWFARYF